MTTNRSQIRLILVVTLSLLAIFATSCAAPETESGDIIRNYYSAIEEDDVDFAAELFSEDATVTVPSGRTFSGMEIKLQYINYDLNTLDHVEFVGDFIESDEQITWTQEYHTVEGEIWIMHGQASIEEGKIVEWTLESQ